MNQRESVAITLFKYGALEFVTVTFDHVALGVEITTVEYLLSVPPAFNFT